MLTFFSIPRSFEGEFDGIQRTAISSWASAVEDAQVILMGDEPGIRDFANGRSFCHAPTLPRNRHGTPLVNGAFHVAESLASHDLLCEISADIVVGGDFAMAIELANELEKPFIVGQRWDLDPGFSSDTAKIHPPSGVDYFIYRRGTLGDIPPFAVGRTAYDNWLIWAAVNLWDLQVINATPSITAIHLNHSYPAWPNGKSEMLAGEEREENHRLAAATGMTRPYGINDAPWEMKQGLVLKRELA